MLALNWRALDLLSEEQQDDFPVVRQASAMLGLNSIPIIIRIYVANTLAAQHLLRTHQSLVPFLLIHSPSASAFATIAAYIRRFISQRSGIGFYTAHGPSFNKASSITIHQSPYRPYLVRTGGFKSNQYWKVTARGLHKRARGRQLALRQGRSLGGILRLGILSDALDLDLLDGLLDDD
jgi:hypothetical protein